MRGIALVIHHGDCDTCHAEERSDEESRYPPVIA
jgi:hypothetical protein